MIQDIGPHRLHNEYIRGKRPKAGDFVFFFEGRSLLVRLGEGTFSLPWAEEAGDAEGLIYLFALDDTAFFLSPGPCQISLADKGFIYKDIRSLRREGYGPKEMYFAALTALQLSSWYRDNRFCGTCGHATVLSDKERAIVCPACGRTIYPRIVPAVIVGVTDGDRILMTKYAGRGIPFYALIAGFTEIGETFEETVAREVMEEVGLKVRNIRYYKSQPWAIADDILAGFYCDVDGDTTIRLDTSELKEGVWMKREEVVLQPDDYSLTNEMMLMFKEGREPKA